MTEGKMTTENPLWENDLIQFARLLSEIRATQVIEYKLLCEATDLEAKDIKSVFDRADKVFGQLKKIVLERKK